MGNFMKNKNLKNAEPLMSARLQQAKINIKNVKKIRSAVRSNNSFHEQITPNLTTPSHSEVERVKF